jgi:hypothetical protein
VIPISDGGITRAQEESLGGAQPPRGSHPRFVQISRGQIFRPAVNERVFEVRGDPVEIVFRVIRGV